MKLLHLSDLHFGKSLHNTPLLEDQTFWVDRVLEAVDRERPDAVVIAGDVYDRGVPGKEAVQLLSRMITALSDRGTKVLLTAGNHDGGERLEFAAEILANQQVYIAGTVQEEMVHVTMQDEFGPVTFWLMPYTTPAAVRVVCGLTDEEVGSYTEAVSALLSRQPIDYSRRNVLVAHQTVLNGKEKPFPSDSETAIGGIGGVDVSVFRDFDYVALGHIHGAQAVGSPRVRYAGAPLCYHFSEAGQQKGLLWVDLGQKGSEIQTRTEEIKVLHRVLPAISGPFDRILAEEETNPTENAYVQVVLTDERIIPEARETLDALFASHGSRMLDLTRMSHSAAVGRTEDGIVPETLSLAEYFCAFYRSRSRDCADPSPEELELINLLARQIDDRRDEKEEVLTLQLVEAARKQAEAEWKQEVHA